MTKAEKFIEAWRLAAREEDFSLVDKIYHPDYSSFDYRAGLEVNLEMDKVVMSTLSEQVTKGPTRTIFEDDSVFVPPILNNIGMLCSRQYAISGVDVGILSPPFAKANSKSLLTNSFKLFTTV